MTEVRKILFKLYVAIRRRLHGYGLSRIPGAAYARDMLFQRLTSDEIVEIQTKEGRFFANKKDRGIVPYLLTTGEYDPDFTSAMKTCLRPGMRAVDVGANFGFYTVAASKQVGPAGLVYAFEPDPENYDLLLRNIELNDCENVRPFRLAIGDRSDTLQLYRDASNLGNHSLRQENVHGSRSTTISVPVRSLDSMLLEPNSQMSIDFIKIDVQGAEEMVIKGASAVLSAGRPQILMEFWPKGLENFGTNPLAMLQTLHELGFEISVVDKVPRKVSPDGLEALATLSEYPDRDHVDLFLSKAGY